jgi:hypothetical protein
MNLPGPVLTLAALAAAAPSMAADAPPTVTTTGAWTPSKPGARQPVADIARVPVTTGPWVSSKPGVRPTSR